MKKITWILKVIAKEFSLSLTQQKLYTSFPWQLAKALYVLPAKKEAGKMPKSYKKVSKATVDERAREYYAIGKIIVKP